MALGDTFTGKDAMVAGGKWLVTANAGGTPLAKPAKPAPKPATGTGTGGSTKGGDYTVEVAAHLGTGETQKDVFASLSTLQLSPTIGNSGSANLTGDPLIVAKMDTGGHVVLGDSGHAWYDGNNWAAGDQT